MANILEIKNLNYKYGNTTIFKNFNLTVKEDIEKANIFELYLKYLKEYLG